MAEGGRNGQAPTRKPRIGIVVPQLGIPSEVWILRQCLEFERIEPVLLYWDIRPGAAGIPPELELIRFRTNFERRRTLWSRIRRRLGSPSAIWPTADQAADIRQVIAEAGVDAVLCHFAWTGLRVSKALEGGPPVVWQVHGRDVSALMSDKAYRRAIAAVLPRVRHLVTVGRFQLEVLRPYGLPERHSVIPCGAPLSLFAQKPLPQRAAGEPLRFISVGRMSAEKGVLETLQAFEQAAERHPDIELDYVGDGPLADELRRAIAASPVGDRVRMRGLLRPDEVAEVLSTGHVYLQHSRMVGGWVEGFGVTLTEAGAAGLPLIASRLGGIVDQVRPGENGFLFEPGDVAEQSAHMALLAGHEDLRRRMGAAARRVAETFDSRLMTRRLEDVLLAAAESGGLCGTGKSGCGCLGGDL